MKVFLGMATAVFMLLLGLPLVQKATGWPPDRPLGGVEPPVAEPDWTWSAWWAGKAQTDFEIWFNRHIGWRGVLVRTANQVAYSLFDELAQGRGTRVVAGREGYFYESVYVDSYRMGGTRSAAEIRRRSFDLRRLQDRLAADGIGFWLVIAPSKAEIYPEHLPPSADVAGRSKRLSHYERMVADLQENGVNVVDAHALFRTWRKDPGTPALFPRSGTHWNRYGAARVVSVLMDRLRETTGNDWPVLTVTGTVTNRKIIPPDNDLGELANLWQRRSLAGPQVHPVIETDPGTEKPNLLLICDSFGAMVGEVLQQQRLVREHDAYYYNTRHHGWPRKRASADNVDPDLPDILRRVAGRDAVVVVEVEYFLPEIGFGFAEQLLKTYDEWDERKPGADSEARFPACEGEGDSAT